MTLQQKIHFDIKKVNHLSLLGKTHSSNSITTSNSQTTEQTLLKSSDVTEMALKINKYFNIKKHPKDSTTNDIVENDIRNNVKFFDKLNQNQNEDKFEQLRLDEK